MKKIRGRVGLILSVFTLVVILLGTFGPSEVLAASDKDVILDGIYMGGIDLSGMTADEARASVSTFVEDLKQRNITFGAVDNH